MFVRKESIYGMGNLTEWYFHPYSAKKWGKVVEKGINQIRGRFCLEGLIT